MPGQEADPRGPRSLDLCQGMRRAWILARTEVGSGLLPGKEAAPRDSRSLDSCQVRRRAWTRAR